MRRMWWWWLAWVVLVAGLATGTTVLANHSDTPEEALQRIRAFVTEHRTYRSTIRGRAAHGAPPFVLHITADGHDHHLEGTIGGVTIEEIRSGRWIYTRNGGGTWQRAEVDEEAAASATGALGEGLRSTLGRLGRIGTASFDGDDLVVRYSPLELLTASDRELLLDDVPRSLRRQLATPATMRISYGPGGRLDRLSSDPTNLAGAQTVTYRDWDADITIQAPSGDDIDTTPDVDEEAIADFEHAPVLAPTDLPQGWRLLSSDVYSRDEDEEYCASVTLTYGPAGSADDPRAVVELLEPDCPYEDDQPSDLDVGTRARFGDHDVVLHDAEDVFIYDEISGGEAATFRAPNGWVFVATTEGQDVLRRLVASLAPYQP